VSRSVRCALREYSFHVSVEQDVDLVH
jgi:hypothetical protein